MDTDNSLTTRFFTKVEKATEGCWEWIASKTADGYGQFKHPEHHYAHRFSYAFHYGSIPLGKQVNHHCDNPGCVNPEHLYAGTHQDNMDDMINRGRWKGGAKRKEICVNGHRIADDFYIVKNTRACRKCIIERQHSPEGKARTEANREHSNELRQIRRAEKKRQLNKESNNV